VSAKIQSSPPKIAQPRQEPAAPVGQKGPAAKAEAPSPAEAPAPHSTDGFERTAAQSTKQQEFDKKFGAASQDVIKQTSDDNCGPAAALMAAGVKAGGSAEQKMAELEAKFTDGKGTSAQQMSQMLAHEGVAVNQGHYKYDQHTVDQTLSKGGKMLALVDSNQINPGANQQEAGSAHWVLVDGKDSQGNYKVKDPATGTAYDIDFSKLSNAVDQNWIQNQAGGMLLVEDAGAGAGAGLAARNAAMVTTTPPGDGGGSKGEKSTGGRESSFV
jgi:hypothetical protein